MSLDDRGKMPPVRIQEKMPRSKKLKMYKDFNSMEKKGIKDFKKHLTIIEKMMKSAENTRKDEPKDIDVVVWNTECLFVTSLLNKEFRTEVIRRNNRWMEEFEERIKMRNQYIRELKSSRKKGEKEEPEQEVKKPNAPAG